MMSVLGIAAEAREVAKNLQKGLIRIKGFSATSRAFGIKSRTRTDYAMTQSDAHISIRDSIGQYDDVFKGELADGVIDEALQTNDKMNNINL